MNFKNNLLHLNKDTVEKVLIIWQQAKMKALHNRYGSISLICTDINNRSEKGV